MKKLKAFIQGIKEFRHSFTPHFNDWQLSKAYDQGREIAHKLTLRHFEN
jgi:hypothetical protein